MVILSIVYFIIAMLLLIVGYFASRSNVKYAKMVVITEIIAIIIYVTGRFMTLPYYSTLGIIFGGILLLAELVSIVQFMCIQYLFGKSTATKKEKAKGLDVYGDNELPTVDILICTYNEPMKLVEKTLAASLNLNYPKDKYKVYICDDGRRKEFEDMAKNYEVEYITRDNNLYAKAGNINNALEVIKGDLFVVLDADMMPKKEFLEKTVGYFIDKSTGFVQTPQAYYNPDMYQYHLNKNIPNEQDFFMRDIQEARAYRGATLHVGTNAVFRRKYVDEIGGYPTCSITEDMAVGMLLQAKGYDSIFINKVLVLGLSASTFGELVKQRDRWCRGNIQVFKHYNPLTLKGLTLSQRICYVDGVLYWFSNLIKMCYIIVPIVFLFTGIHFVQSDFAQLLNITIPYIVVQIFIFIMFSPKSRGYMWTHYYEMAMAPHLSLSILKELFGFEIKFNVTSKELEIDKGYYDYKVVIPHLLILIFGLISLLLGIKLLQRGYITQFSYYLNVLLNVFNLIGIIQSLRVAYQAKVSQDEDKATIEGNLETNCILLDNEGNHLDETEVLIESISSKKIWIRITDDLDVGQKILIKLKKEYVKCRVLNRDGKKLELKFLRLTTEQMKEVIAIYIHNLTPYYKIDKKQVFIEDKNSKLKEAV